MNVRVMSRGALVAVVLSASALAQGHGPMSDPAATVVLPEGKDGVSVPFVSRGNHVVLEARINGSAPLSLVLDTGMPGRGVMLYETQSVKAIGLAFGPIRARIGGAGGSGQRLEARVADGVRIQIGDLALEGARAIVIPPIATFPTGNDGVIGAALFNALTVRVDQDAQVLEMSRPGTRQAQGRAVPITLQHNVPYAPAEVVMAEGGTPVPVTLVVDLGAMHAVSLNSSSDPRLAVPAKALATRLGRGVSGAVDGQAGRISSLSLAGLTVRNVVAGFPSKDHESPRGADSRNGNLGMAVLRQMNVTFDYAAQKMYVEPARSFGEPFEWDMSGLVLDPAEGGGLWVRGVLAGTPAAEVGLAVGDHILKLGGETVGAADLLRVREQLRKDGASLELTVRRGEETRDLTLKLRRLV